MRLPEYTSAIGIQTGDRVTTDYGTGPYQVWRISGPHEEMYNCSDPLDPVHPNPEVYGLQLVPAPDHPHHDREWTIENSNFFYINEVARLEDGSYVTLGYEPESGRVGVRDRLTVEEPKNPLPCQDSLFGGAA